VTREANLVTKLRGRERKKNLKKEKSNWSWGGSKGQPNLQASSRWSRVLFKHNSVVTAGAFWD